MRTPMKATCDVSSRPRVLRSVKPGGSRTMPRPCRRSARSERLTSGAKNTRLGCPIANIYTRTPTLLAQTASALADLAAGRFCLGIGTSSPAIVENWNGVALEQPVARMRQTLAFLKEALTGEKMAATIGPYNIRGFRLARPPSAPPRVYVAALRE